MAGFPSNSNSALFTQSAGTAQPAEQRLQQLSNLLENLDEVRHSQVTDEIQKQNELEDRLAIAKLGIAGGLFSALRAKHAPTASHCLRVALGCSTWAEAIGLKDPQLRTLEISALLHDIGKIGAPDQILSKPSKLAPEEIAILDRCRNHGLEILTSCCSSPDIIDIVRFTGTWFNGQRGSTERCGDRLPVGSRILSIVDAFDSMTTDHVYRKAMTRERALAELSAFAGTQFDPRLVESFCKLVQSDDVQMHARTTQRWLSGLSSNDSLALWSPRTEASSPDTNLDTLFQHKLVSCMRDGVIFVDTQGNILAWNRAMERMTGLISSSLFQRQWQPSIVELRDEKGEIISDSNCPISKVIRSGDTYLNRVVLQGRSGSRVTVEMQVYPVTGREGLVFGAVAIVHDISSEVTLEEAVEILHTKATQDPLTKVANRAEFDRVHQLFVAEHLTKRVPCSLIICDLDYFKRVNDDYGHQAGDDALMIFASMLKRHRRQGDLVARYGGEEFVMLCANCDANEAVSIAEGIRTELERTPQTLLKGKCCTSSFGVTEIQVGDTADTMLRRADRALQQAKDSGRNRVVQLGAGLTQNEAPSAKKSGGFLSWFSKSNKENESVHQLICRVPLLMAVEKLRGFISDQHGQIVKIEGNSVLLKVDGNDLGMQRRRGDKGVPFVVSIEFEEVTGDKIPVAEGVGLATLISVRVDPIRNKDRRRDDLNAQVENLLCSIKAYFMAERLGENQSQAPALERAVTKPADRYGKSSQAGH